jgi:flavin-dependent dehydrogenase
MDGGQVAAMFLDEALNHGNYDAELMSLYHQRWMEKFGSDFKWFVQVSF